MSEEEQTEDLSDLGVIRSRALGIFGSKDGRVVVSLIDEAITAERTRREATEATAADHQRHLVETIHRANAAMDVLRGAHEAETAALRERAEKAEAEVVRLTTKALLHPTGRCTCFGESRCDWCARTSAKLALAQFQAEVGGALGELHTDQPSMGAAVHALRAERDTLTARLAATERERDEMRVTADDCIAEATRLRERWGQDRAQALLEALASRDAALTALASYRALVAAYLSANESPLEGPIEEAFIKLAEFHDELATASPAALGAKVIEAAWEEGATAMRETAVDRAASFLRMVGGAGLPEALAMLDPAEVRRRARVRGGR